MNNSQKGFLVPLLIGIIALLVIGGGVYIYENKKAELSTVVDTSTQQSLNQAQQQTDNQNNIKILTDLKCEKYTDSISKKIDQYNASQKPRYFNSDNTGEAEHIDLYINNNVLKEVFYSPKTGSCLYLESRRSLVKVGPDAKPDIGNWSIAYETYYLIDALTSKEIPFYKGISSMQIISRGSQFYSEKEAADALSYFR